MLVITFISAGIAGLLAVRDGGFDLAIWSAVTLGLLLAHATNNLLNDFTDHVKGVDRDNYFRAQYGPHPLEHGLMSRRELLTYAAVTGLGALAIGAFLVATRGPLTLPFLLAGAFFVLFYTYPLKYIGLGEIAVLVVWGPLMIGGAYYVITGRLDGNVALAGLPYALGATTVIFGKHIDKLADDRAKRIRTLPVILGGRAARAVVVAMFVLQYALVVYLVLVGFFTPVMLVVLFALPKLRDALAVFREPKPESRPAAYPADTWPLYYVAYAFGHNRRYGLLFLIGLVTDVVVRALVRFT